MSKKLAFKIPVASEVVLLPVGNLEQSKENPRTISDESTRKLMKDILADSQFMWSRPILVNQVDGKNIVYAGNQRLAACKLLGWESVPVIISIDLPESTTKSRMALDNIHFGQFDKDKLSLFSEDDLNDFEIKGNMDDFEFNSGTHVKTGEAKEAKKESEIVKTLNLIFDTEEEKDEFDMMVSNLGMTFEEWVIAQIEEDEE